MNATDFDHRWFLAFLVSIQNLALNRCFSATSSLVIKKSTYFTLFQTVLDDFSSFQLVSANFTSFQLFPAENSDFEVVKLLRSTSCNTFHDRGSANQNKSRFIT